MNMPILQQRPRHSAASAPQRAPLQSLQWGRGIAAMAVAAFHLSLILAEPRYLGVSVFSNLTQRGNLGVDFFFVLSGFIIIFAHGQDINNPHRYGNYILKRFLRLFPIYWLYTGLFCSLLALGIGTAATLPSNLPDWVSTLFLVRLSSFEAPIAPAWTLIHEVAFYLVFSLLILNRKLGLTAITVWLFLGLLPGLYTSTFPDEGSRTPLTTYFSPLNFNFLIGMSAYILWKHAKAQYTQYLVLLGAALFIVCYWIEQTGVPYEKTQIAYGLAFGCIIAGAAAWERSIPYKARLSPLTLIGNASYTIYLTHLAFLGLFSKIMIKLSGFVALSNTAIYISTLAFTIVSGCIVYLLVEKPLLKTMQRLTTTIRKPSIAEPEVIK